MRDPSLIPDSIKQELKSVGLWDLDPRNLYRITWHNEPTPSGGGYGPVNYVELPSELTGTSARILLLEGKWFPTGAHKVGAAFGCLVPRLVTGQFDPVTQKAVWPSTGNYCRGGAYDSHLLACESVAILPEGMSKERFEWLKTVAGEIIATPGTESNVKEIFDKCNELRASGEDLVIFNQFDEFGNYLWHYAVTGPAMVEVLEAAMRPGDEFRGVTLTTGSAGTIASGDYLKQLYPNSKIAAGEAIQCPTILYNGFGEHRIEGIGDKHIPWIHNAKNTDMAIGLDDEATICPDPALQRTGRPVLSGRPGRIRGVDREAPAARYLRDRQHAHGDQDGQVLRNGIAGCRHHRRDRLDGDVRKPPEGTQRGTGRVHHPRRGCGLPPLPARTGHRPCPGTRATTTASGSTT